VVVGNHHRVLSLRDDGEPCHECSMYVMFPAFPASKLALITQVAYSLHPSPFNSSDSDTTTCTLNKSHSPSFELTLQFASSAPFPQQRQQVAVCCTIYWEPLLGVQQQTTRIVHELVFNELGGQTSATISISPRRLQFFA